MEFKRIPFKIKYNPVQIHEVSLYLAEQDNVSYEMARESLVKSVTGLILSGENWLIEAGVCVVANLVDGEKLVYEVEVFVDLGSGVWYDECIKDLEEFV